MAGEPLRVTVHAARSLPAADAGGTSDPFVELHLAGVTHKTKTIKKTLSPTWNEVFTFHPGGFNLRNDALMVLVYDWDRFSKNDLIAQTAIPLARFLTKGTADEWFTLNNEHHKPISASIHLSITYGRGIGPEEVQAQAPPVVPLVTPPAVTTPPPVVTPPFVPPPEIPPVTVPPFVPGPAPIAHPVYNGPTFGLNKTEVADAERKFYEYDKDASFTIDRQELKPLLRSCFGNRMGDGLMDRFASAHMQGADKDKSGQIDFREFLELYSKLKQFIGQ